MGHNRKKGFTIVEIMIVIAIVGLLIVIAIPNIRRARLSSNEVAAEGSMRLIVTALENYRADAMPPAYPISLAKMAKAEQPYLDADLMRGEKQGYVFKYYPAPPVNLVLGGKSHTVVPAYSLVAVPAESGVSGNATYFAKATGVIYADKTHPYTMPPMQYETDVPSGLIASSR